ncbi:BON domain-containing protein [Thiohalomonas denitrificans]|uniref:BON domain-containing protein n=1 Tax=Thiohalomonas denitrificans TaxID=415747 RepID=UPI0026F309A0|nr:BON domain-containing protein [Thiohalomonas denitrificans]
MDFIRRVFLVLITVTTIVAVSGCATAVMTGAAQGGYDPDNGRSARQVPADAEISAAVTRALVHHPQIPAMPITVRTEQGRVTLSGEVPDRDTARRAARLAAAVPGVESVRNLLRVE